MVASRSNPLDATHITAAIMSFTHVLFLTYCLAAYVALPLIAQDWQQRGSDTYGVSTKLVWVEPNTLIMHHDGKVRRSADGGSTWVESDGKWGNAAGRMTSAGDTLYLVSTAVGGSGNYGVYASTNQGASFELRGSEQLSNAAFMHVFASGGRLGVGTNRAGLFLSSDGGRTFEKIAVPQSVGVVADVHFDGRRWAIVGSSGAAWSSDDGISWQTIRQPSSVVTGNPQIARFVGNRLVVSSNFGAFVVDASNNAVSTTGLPEYAGLPGIIQDMAVGGSELYAVVTPFGGRTMVYVLPAGSTEWQRLGTTDWDNRHGSQRGMLCATPQGVYLHHALSTTQEGATWFFARMGQTSVQSQVDTERYRIVVEGNRARIVGVDEAWFEEIVGLQGQRYVVPCVTTPCSTVDVSLVSSSMCLARVRTVDRSVTVPSVTVPFVIVR